MRRCLPDGRYYRGVSSLLQMPADAVTPLLLLFVLLGTPLLVLTVITRIRYQRLKSRERELERLVNTTNRELKEATLLDHLTGLPNRRFVHDIVEPEFAALAGRRQFALDNPTRRRRETMAGNHALYLVNIDGFKEVNKRHGFPAGDEILKELSRLLKKTVRQDDIVVRWGGQEFLVILKYTEPDYVTTFADKLTATVRRHGFHVAGGAEEGEEKGEVRLSVSVGYVQFPVDPMSPGLVDVQQALEMAAVALGEARGK